MKNIFVIKNFAFCVFTTGFCLFVMDFSSDNDYKINICVLNIAFQLIEK